MKGEYNNLTQGHKAFHDGVLKRMKTLDVSAQSDKDTSATDSKIVSGASITSRDEGQETAVAPDPEMEEKESFEMFESSKEAKKGGIDGVVRIDQDKQLQNLMKEINDAKDEDCDNSTSSDSCVENDVLKQMDLDEKQAKKSGPSAKKNTDPSDIHYQIAGHLRGGTTGKWYDLVECFKNEDGTYRVRYANTKETRKLRLADRVMKKVKSWRIREKKKEAEKDTEGKVEPEILTSKQKQVLNSIVQQADPSHGGTEQILGFSTAGREDQTEIYIRGLKFETAESDIRELFQDCGNITEIRIPRTRTGKHKGFAFINFESPDSASAALELDKVELHGRYLDVSRVKNTNYNAPYVRKMRPRPSFCKTIFVGNLAWKATSKDVENAFMRCGNIQGVRMAVRSNFFRVDGNVKYIMPASVL